VQFAGFVGETNNHLGRMDHQGGEYGEHPKPGLGNGHEIQIPVSTSAGNRAAGKTPNGVRRLAKMQASPALCEVSALRP
jgi:hypothetical protein